MRYVPLLLSLIISVHAFAAEASGGTRVSLSAESEVQLPNDELVVRFTVETEGKDTSALRVEVNRISQDVHARLKAEEGLKWTTMGRSLEPIWEYDRLHSKNIRTGWRMVQSTEVITQKLESVSGWLDAIEVAGAQIKDLTFRVSSETLRRAQNDLRMQAIAAFRAKATDFAKGLDAPDFRILELQTDSPPVYPMRAQVMRSMEADKATAAAPVLNSGESQVSVRISGTIEIPFKDFPAR